MTPNQMTRRRDLTDCLLYWWWTQLSHCHVGLRLTCHGIQVEQVCDETGFLLTDGFIFLRMCVSLCFFWPAIWCDAMLSTSKSSVTSGFANGSTLSKICLCQNLTIHKMKDLAQTDLKRSWTWIFSMQHAPTVCKTVGHPKKKPLILVQISTFGKAGAST